MLLIKSREGVLAVKLSHKLSGIQLLNAENVFFYERIMNEKITGSDGDDVDIGRSSL